ncbi:phosphatase PAP2 family protein [Natrialba swarupiae]|uniref:Phosphatase PAP2 family protein n=1 Tax=Natrialba swarupiae TaxID=2448032 RepID=A0A5D5AMM9_9EURY|nr:phosphatase PAP2 family protein [Natrialba swarupiae]TYT62137.1 phosphatase PAP2 family protein [Natrialba swarupiae]
MNRSLGVTELIRRLLPEWTVPLFELTAVLGDELLVVAVLLGIGVVDVGRSIRSDDDRLLSADVATLLGIVLGGLALTLALKTALDFSRPPASMQAVPRDSAGFPSGHTMAATILWGALAAWIDRGTPRVRLLAAAIVVSLVGVSRLALGVHYLVDVLASVGVGAGYLLVATRIADGEPTRAFAGATVLGGAALLITAGSTDGWLAFVGCVGAAAGWWTISRPSVRNRLLAVTR